jgi:isochorismate hydrolase
MKECYFTTQSLEEQALDLFNQVREPRHTGEIVFQPGRSALLVLDMQSYFLEESSHAYIPSAVAIVRGIANLVSEFSRLGRPIIFTQHINTDSDAGMMAVWWREVITLQNQLHRIIPELNPVRGTVVQKSQYDAFYQTDLDEMLKTNGVTQVVVTGVMTHLCCETTARSAFMRGYQVFFPVDGTATYSLEHHRASLVNLAHGFASIVLMRDIFLALRGVHAN